MTLIDNREGTFNRLLQDELRVVASYETARTRLGDEDPQARELSRIQAEHRSAAEWLRKRAAAGVRGGSMSVVRWALSIAAWFAMAVGGLLLLLLTLVSGGTLLAVGLFVASIFFIGATPFLAWGTPPTAAKDASERSREAERLLA